MIVKIVGLSHFSLISFCLFYCWGHSFVSQGLPPPTQQLEFQIVSGNNHQCSYVFANTVFFLWQDKLQLCSLPLGISLSVPPIHSLRPTETIFTPLSHFSVKQHLFLRILGGKKVQNLQFNDSFLLLETLNWKRGRGYWENGNQHQRGSDTYFSQEANTVIIHFENIARIVNAVPCFSHFHNLMKHKRYFENIW